MSIGPCEIIVIGFPGNEFDGSVAPALAKLVEAELVRIIDLVFVVKDTAGDVTALELSSVPDHVRDAFEPVLGEASGLVSDEDVEDLAESLAPGSSAAVLLFEHTWASELAEAVSGSGGELLASIRIPREVVEEVMS